MANETRGEVGRNDPCPCGSGKKYKQCCGDKTAGESVQTRTLVYVLVAVVVVAGAIGALRTFGGTDTPASQTPAAWEYDAENDQHWHPQHNHWHQGPPPTSGTESPAASGSESTPEPWEYDAENDRHWHPQHNHWHGGPPPDSAGSGNGNR